jgi:hypothetical protein
MQNFIIKDSKLSPFFSEVWSKILVTVDIPVCLLRGKATFLSYIEQHRLIIFKILVWRAISYELRCIGTNGIPIFNIVDAQQLTYAFAKSVKLF